MSLAFIEIAGYRLDMPTEIIASNKLKVTEIDLKLVWQAKYKSMQIKCRNGLWSLCVQRLEEAGKKR